MNQFLKAFLLIGLLISLTSCKDDTYLPEIEPPTSDVTENSFPSIAPEVARDEVIEYLVQQYPDELAPLFVNATWEKVPEPETHTFAVYGYRNPQWQIDLTVLPANVIEIDGVTLEEDTYDISVSFLSPPPYIRWVGLLAKNSGIIEQSYVNRSEILETIPPEQARDLAVQYIQDRHPSNESTIEIPWESIGSLEEGGEIVNAYQAGEWTVNVRWSEYTGEFSVNGYYEHIGDQYVEIDWNLIISADGNDITEERYMYFGGE